MRWVTTLPGGLAEAVEKAEVFSADNSYNNVVVIELRKDEMRLKGVGAMGWFEEKKQIRWRGDDISFYMAPKLLTELTEKTNDCIIAPGRLKVDSGKFTYMICLGSVNNR